MSTIQPNVSLQSHTIHSVEQVFSNFKLVWNHKQEGVAFYSMMPILKDPSLVKSAIHHLCLKIKEATIDFDSIVGLDSRGYIVGSLLAYELGKPFVMAAKKGKLPGKVWSSEEYKTEYSSGNAVEIDKESISIGQRILVVDDLLATGGSANSVIEIVTNPQKANASIVGIVVLGDVAGLQVLDSVKKYPIIKLGTFNADPSTNPLNNQELFPLNNQALVSLNTENLVPLICNTFKNNFPVPDRGQDYSIVVLYHPSMYSWAKIFQQYCRYFKVMEIEWNQYPDKTPNVKFARVLKQLTENHNDVVFLMNLMDMSKIVEQLSLLYILPDYTKSQIQAIIPYYSVGTQERIVKSGDLALGNTLAKMISLPITRGPIDLTIYDLHSPPSIFNFGEKIRPNYNEYETTGLKQLFDLIDAENITIAFPDDGAYKRFSTLEIFKKKQFPTIVFLKKRDDKDPSKRSLYFKEAENFPNDCRRGTPEFCHQLRHVLIIDDLVQSGGTLDECRKALLVEGAQYVSCYVTHAVFPNQAYKKFLPGGCFAGMHQFIVTNTNPQTTMEIQKLNETTLGSPFYVINLAFTAAKAMFDDAIYMPRFNIELTSSSKIKKEALEMAINNLMMLPDLSINHSKSNVNNQPVGLKEMTLGCENRLKESQRRYTGTSGWYKLCIAVENGIIQDTSSGLYYDYPLIMSKCETHCYTKLGQRTYVPTSVFEESKAAKFKITCGEILAYQTREQLLQLVLEYEKLQGFTTLSTLDSLPNITHDDWHLLFGPKSRKQILKEEFTEFFSHAF